MPSGIEGAIRAHHDPVTDGDRGGIYPSRVTVDIHVLTEPKTISLVLPKGPFVYGVKTYLTL
jgi:hypothetical protein